MRSRRSLEAPGGTHSVASIAPDQYRAALLQVQVPEDIIELVLYPFGTVLGGRNTSVTDGVRRALVRAPLDGAYAQRAAASGVWGG